MKRAVWSHVMSRRSGGAKVDIHNSDLSVASNANRGRDAAIGALVAAFSEKGFIHEAISRRRAAGLDARETGLASEIALGTMRHVVTIEHVLSAVARYEPKRADATLKSVLYSAAFQAIWMDRVPLFAAVDEAVELARRVISRGAAGMVNAIMRRLCSAISDRRTMWRERDATMIRTGWASACRFSRSVLPPPEGDSLFRHIAAATGERPGRLAVLAERHGMEDAEQIAWAGSAIPPVVARRNALRIGAAEFAERIGQELRQARSEPRLGVGEGIDVHQESVGVEIAGDVAYVSAEAFDRRMPLLREGLAFVQDETAAVAASILEAQPGERVLDLCAAPGGKTTALAIQMRNRGEIVASDSNSDRLTRVEENVQRMGLTCVTTRETAALSDADLFDAVLVDAPCSNSGVVARRPEARLRLRPKYLQSLEAIQARLLRQAAAFVKPGGRLAYSTCSIEPEENENIVAQFLRDRAEWTLTSETRTKPHWGERLSEWRDGGYAAGLRRAAQSSHK